MLAGQIRAAHASVRRSYLIDDLIAISISICLRAGVAEWHRLHARYQNALSRASPFRRSSRAARAAPLAAALSRAAHGASLLPHQCCAPQRTRMFTAPLFSRHLPAATAPLLPHTARGLFCARARAAPVRIAEGDIWHAAALDGRLAPRALRCAAEARARALRTPARTYHYRKKGAATSRSYTTRAQRHGALQK